MKKLAFAMMFSFAMVGYVIADDFTATITKVDGNNITYTGKNAKKGEKGDDGKVVASDTVKVNNGTAKKGEVTVGDKIEKGLKDDMFKDIAEGKGLKARITTNDKGVATDIVVLKGGGKAKKGGGGQ